MFKQELSQKLLQKLSPQQIQLMKLVQLPTLAFEQRIQQEIEENPALEEGKNEEDVLAQEDYDFSSDSNETEDYETIDTSDINIDEYLSNDEIPHYKTQSNNYSDDDDEYSVPYAQSKTFHEYLSEQLHSYALDEEKMIIAEFILGNLDESGYLRRELSSIVDDLAFGTGIYTEESVLEEILVNYIQKLDPTGIGARSLQECLLIQLGEKVQNYSVELAYTIIEETFDLFVKKHYKKIISKFSITEEELKLAIQEIEKLNPKPGKAFSDNTKNNQQITPDFIIKITDGELELTLNRRNAPELKVSKSYQNMLETYKEANEKTKEQKDAVFFVKQKLDSAKWFIDAIKQRQNTLYHTMYAIMEYQKEYFLTGEEENLKPMILKDIADRIQMDISTISRVANSKYVSTPYGTILIKDLFSESLTNDEGEEVSTREVKKILTDVVEQENKRKPLTDEKLTTILKEKGYNIARRTVAKYREQLNIPVARLRKEL
ncbi:MAG: RNA polymerase factor sigma-54 [Flavobacteriales bacterium]|nr:RNA polymerase factor sigma-54 [Flavobacteriales bacterium]